MPAITGYATQNALAINGTTPASVKVGVHHVGPVKGGWAMVPFYRLVEQVNVISGGRYLFSLFPDKYDEIVDAVNPDYATRQLIEYLGYLSQDEAMSFPVSELPETARFLYKLKLPLTEDTHLMIDQNALRDYLRIEFRTRSDQSIRASPVILQTMPDFARADTLAKEGSTATNAAVGYWPGGAKPYDVVGLPEFKTTPHLFDMRLYCKMTTFPQAVSNAYQQQYRADWAVKTWSPQFMTYIAPHSLTPRMLRDGAGSAHAVVPLRSLTVLAEQLLIQAHPDFILNAGLRGKRYALPIKRVDLYSNGRLISGEFLNQEVRTYQATGQFQLSGSGSTVAKTNASEAENNMPYAVLNFSRYPAMKTAFVGGLAMGSLSDAYLHIWFEMPYYFNEPINFRSADHTSNILVTREVESGGNRTGFSTSVEAVSSYALGGLSNDAWRVAYGAAEAAPFHEHYPDHEFKVTIDVCAQATTLMQYRTLGGYGQGELRSTTQI